MSQSDFTDDDIVMEYLNSRSYFEDIEYSDKKGICATVKLVFGGKEIKSRLEGIKLKSGYNRDLYYYNIPELCWRTINDNWNYW